MPYPPRLGFPDLPKSARDWPWSAGPKDVADPANAALRVHHSRQTSVRMVKCEGSGSATGDGLDFFNTEKKASVHYVPCKIACANCRSPLFDEVRQTSHP